MQQQELANIDKEYISLNRAVKIIGNMELEPKNVSSSFLKTMQKLDRYFKVVKLEKRHYFKEDKEIAEYIILKKDVLNFKENFISRLEAYPMQNYYNRKDTLEKYLVKKKVEIVKIAQKDNLVFYNKKHFNKFLNEKKSPREEATLSYTQNLVIDGWVYRNQLCEKFSISSGTWGKIAKTVELEKKVEKGRTYYKEKDVADLLTSIRLGIDELYEKYYSATYLKNEYNLTRHTGLANPNLEAINVPKHYRPLLPYQDVNYFYTKESIDRYLKQKAFYSVSTTNPYDTYKYKLSVSETVFPEQLSKTEELWENFVKDYIRTRKQNLNTLEITINRLVKAATIISGSTKEIFEMSSNEINLLFFNGNSKNMQQVLYYFVKGVHNYFFDVFRVKPFNLANISSKHKIKTQNIKEKEIYEIREYRLYHSYSSKLSLHKKKAIEDALKHIKRSSESSKYDSAWLYVLMHLNNTWRHSEVVYGVPRVDLTKTKIKDLNWLKNNDIDEEDMKIILYQVKRKVSLRNHHKNNGERFFFWSEELAYCLANAIAICELRTQAVKPNATHLVDFKTKNQTFSNQATAYNEFFRLFKSDIKFESLKMNRTVLSYTFSVIKNCNAEEALATTQHLRGHLDKETTNIYIMIPQNEMDFLISQLFERDNFGYIPYVISNILIGEEKRDLKLKTEEIKAIKEEFGDIYKIEFFASFLNDIISERVGVEEILKSAELYEIDALNLKLITKQLPAKQKNYQCLVSQQGCHRPEIKNCSNCLLSIPNYYALSGITQRLKERVIKMMTEFPKLELKTDKIRYAKLFNRDMLLLKDAIDKYGKEEVFELMEISVEDYRLLLSELPSLKKYIESENN